MKKTQSAVEVEAVVRQSPAEDGAIAENLAEWLADQLREMRPSVILTQTLTSLIATTIYSAVAKERERCASLAELDSILDWVGGSTGNAKGTAMRIAKAIRNGEAV